MTLGKYFSKPIDEARNDLIGTQITDIESNGKVIHTKNKEGREFSIDATGDSPVVNAWSTQDEDIEALKTIVRNLLEKLNIELDDLFNE